MTYLLFCSGGNDSIALLQYMKEQGHKDCTVLYNMTGWEMEGWLRRIVTVKTKVLDIGWKFKYTESEGFESMVRKKKGFPMAASKMSFCTKVLKTQPTLKWLKENDPNKNFVCCAGVRREESQNRANHPMNITDDLYEFRTRHFPIVKIKEQERNELVKRFGFDVLPHSSMECFPCVNSNRKDLRLLASDEERINKIESLENEMGFTSKGKPRVMFRPYRHMGAIGIREVVKWAMCERGEYVNDL